MMSGLAAATLRVATPLIFAAVGGLISERSGVINIALEGMMLVGAFAAAASAYATHSPWLGTGAGMLAGAIFALLYALAAIRLRANQIVAGTALNILAFGLTPFLCKLFYDVTGSTPQVPLGERFQSAPMFLAWVLVAVIYLWLKYFRGGLRLSFAGEQPDALRAAGFSVTRVRWLAVIASGALAGIGGATLSIFLASSFSRGMTAGRGFIALAALIFGKWRPIPTACACLLFGFAEAAQIRLQGVKIGNDFQVPVQLIQIMPYLLSMIVLAGFVGKARPPAALGRPEVD